VLAALSDDLNTPLAIAEMHKLRASARLGSFEAAQRLWAAGEFIGLNWSNVSSREDEANFQEGAAQILDWSGEIHRAIEARKVARASRDFAEGDRIRDELLAQGIVLEDYKDENGVPQTKWSLKQ
jgi:cysteinyl-tRNA synthetase